MSLGPNSDEELLRRLPLPLAQLYRRARNGKTPVDRHHNAYYLAEATLKLAASLRVGAALDAGLDHHSPLARSLEQLCLPSVGHWVGAACDPNNATIEPFALKIRRPMIATV